MKRKKTPMQPIELDEHGVARFRENPFVRYLVDNADLNTLALMNANGFGGKPRNEAYSQLMQLIGYSVNGYGDLSTSPQESVSKADRKAAKLVEKAVIEAERIKGKQ